MENKDMLDPKTEQEKTETNGTEPVPPVVVTTQEELDDLQTKVRNLPESKWNLLQRIAGGALGLLCGYLLSFFSTYESVGMYGNIAAVLIALFVPGMIEKRVKRSVQKGRIALMIGIGVWLLAYLAFMLINGQPMIEKA